MCNAPVMAFYVCHCWLTAFNSSLSGELMRHMCPALQGSMPESPAAVRKRYLDVGLPIADVLILTDEKPFSRYFDAALEAGAPPKLAANWVLGDVMAHSKVIICQINAVRAILCNYHILRRSRAGGQACNNSAIIMQVYQISFDKLDMAPSALAELVCAIDEGLVSGKIGKQVLPLLLLVSA